MSDHRPPRIADVVDQPPITVPERNRRIARITKSAVSLITINASTGWRAMMRSSAAINPGLQEPRR
jgi:hypothetical protein